MADSTESVACASCGGPLDDYSLDRGTCHDCRSPKGTIADLAIAILASGDDPKRISDWPAIRHLLRAKFGEDRSDADLWGRCTDWLQAEGWQTPNDYLPLSLKYLRQVLEHGFPPPKLELANHALKSIRIGLISRLLFEPINAELSLRALAILEAYLQQKVSITADQRNKLERICDFNRNLRMSREREKEQQQSKQEEEATNQQVIDVIERQTPTLEPKSVEWLAARKKNEEKLGLPLATLRTYRLVSNGGRKMPDEMFGIDRDGRQWRRQGTPKSMVYYFVPSLPKASK